MHRRRLLAALGASAATSSFAGCVSDDGDDDSDDGDGGNGGNGSDDGEDVDVASRIESADESLEAAADEFEAELDSTNDPLGESSNAIETRTITAHLDEAENDLEGAKSAATDDQREQIEALEDVAAFFRDFVDAFSALGDAMDEVDTADQYIENDRYEDATEALERAESDIDTANDRLVTARSTFDGIDVDALEEVDNIQYTELEGDLEEVDELVDLFGTMLVGLRRMTEGLLPFQEATNALERESYGEAARQYSNAASKFQASNDTFTDAETTAPAEYRSDFIELSCYTGALHDGSKYYERGSRALESGDTRQANEYFEQGQQALDRCESSDQSLSLR